MRKFVLLCMITALLLSLAAGCARREEDKSTAQPPASTESTPAPSPSGVPTGAPTPQPTAQPTAEPTPAPTAAAAVSAGSYVYESAEHGYWQLNLKDNGTFSIISRDSIYNGEGWSTNPNGSVTTGPTEAAGAAPFFDEFGSSVWEISGGTCTPVY